MEKMNADEGGYAMKTRKDPRPKPHRVTAGRIGKPVKSARIKDNQGERNRYAIYGIEEELT